MNKIKYCSAFCVEIASLFILVIVIVIKKTYTFSSSSLSFFFSSLHFIDDTIRISRPAVRTGCHSNPRPAVRGCHPV